MSRLVSDSTLQLTSSPDEILDQIRENILSFKDARTADEMRRLNREHRLLNDQLETIIDYLEATG